MVCGRLGLYVCRLSCGDPGWRRQGWHPGCPFPPVGLHASQGTSLIPLLETDPSLLSTPRVSWLHPSSPHCPPKCLVLTSSSHIILFRVIPRRWYQADDGNFGGGDPPQIGNGGGWSLGSALRSESSGFFQPAPSQVRCHLTVVRGQVHMAKSYSETACVRQKEPGHAF